MRRILLGRGRLSWDGVERRSDRYGAVNLADDDSGEGIALDVAPGLEGTRGRLVAVVVATRTSEHIGDLHRGIFPKTPAVGEEIVLGEGEFFRERIAPGIPHEPSEVERADAAFFRALEAHYRALGATVTVLPGSERPRDSVGLRPGDGRERDWLDPVRLYRCHSQTVELYFVPAGEEG